MKKYLVLFWTMFKIGLFTFGGGYAMIAIFEHEFVEKKKWLSSDEFLNLVSIAETTPGPIAINASTYIGYRIGKILGSVIATIAMVLPSFIIILLIAIFFNKFMDIKIIQDAFKGIKVVVIFLIISAGIKLLIKLEKNVFNYVVLILTIILMIVFSLFAVNFSAIFYILISGFIGLLILLIKNKKEKKVNKNV